MNLGEKIYALRTQKGMSQGDLAEKLNVSRQSISKWENNSAQPDLDKIVKLSEIFDISLDELIKGEKSKNDNSLKNAPNSDFDDKTTKDTPKVEYVYIQPQKAAVEGRIIVCIIFSVIGAIMFFGILFAAGSIGGIFYAIPFWILALVCYIAKNNTGLWCCWTAYIFADVFMRFATGIAPGNILHTFRWTQSMNYGRLIFAWVWFILLAALVVYTAIKIKDKPINNPQKLTVLMVTGWAVYIGHGILLRMIFTPDFYTNILNNGGNLTALSFANNIVALLKVMLFAALIGHTVRLLVYKKNK